MLCLFFFKKMFSFFKIFHLRPSSNLVSQPRLQQQSIDPAACHANLGHWLCRCNRSPNFRCSSAVVVLGSHDSPLQPICVSSFTTVESEPARQEWAACSHCSAEAERWEQRESLVRWSGWVVRLPWRNVRRLPPVLHLSWRERQKA